MSKGNKKTKKVIMFIFLAAIIVLALFLLIKAKGAADADRMYEMSTNAQRVEYLNSQGWIVNPDPVSKTKITIPSEFNEAYTQYNDLQLSQGLDLTPYKGEEAMLYTYKILNFPDNPDNVTANLLIVNDRLVAADITITGEGGFTCGITGS